MGFKQQLPQNSTDAVAQNNQLLQEFFDLPGMKNVNIEMPEYLQILEKGNREKRRALYHENRAYECLRIRHPRVILGDVISGTKLC